MYYIAIGKGTTERIQTMSEYSTELYEVNNGSAYLITWDANGDMAWCAGYDEVDGCAVDDLISLAKGADPVDECWEYGTLEESELESVFDCAKCGFADLIASTYGFDGTLGSLLELNGCGEPKSERLAEMLAA